MVWSILSGAFLFIAICLFYFNKPRGRCREKEPQINYMSHVAALVGLKWQRTYFTEIVYSIPEVYIESVQIYSTLQSPENTGAVYFDEELFTSTQSRMRYCFL